MLVLGFAAVLRMVLELLKSIQSSTKNTFRLRVSLLTTLPFQPVWRVVTVPKHFTLDFLHPLLQVVRIAHLVCLNSFCF